MKNTTLKQIASIASLLVAFLLVIIKFMAWFFTGSLIILSSMTDSLLDLLTSLINFLSIKYSNKPEDSDHKFGHTAIEDIAGFIQSIVIATSGIFIIFQATVNLIEKNKIQCDVGCVSVMVISLVLTIGLVSFQKYVIKKTRSLVVSADSLHYQTDILMNIVFIISLVLITRVESLYFLDPIMALLVAIYILKSSFGIGINAFNNLMGKEVDEETYNKIVDIITSQNNVKNYHDLKTRNMGSKTIIQVHIEIDKKLSFQNAHKIADNLEKKIKSKIEECEIIIHQDPV